jgi:hypothetical protein
MNTLHHAPRPSTHEDRDVVTPANDLLYSMAWLNLEGGPMLLTIPSSARHPGRYFVLPLYDAYTENFENLGPRNCNPEGETVVLLGPGGQVPPSMSHLRAVHCPTHLVWLMAASSRATRATGPQRARCSRRYVWSPRPAPCSRSPRRHRALVRRARGRHGRSLRERRARAAGCAALFHQSLPGAGRGARPHRGPRPGRLAGPGRPGARRAFSWEALDEPTRAGLIEGFADGVRPWRPWAATAVPGRGP